jgi:hypothetical protein
MTATEMRNISNPVNGLLVYVTDDDKFYYYDGLQWRDLSAATYKTTYKASITGGNWYRIASNAGDRADAQFTLRDHIFGGGHSSLRFIAGINYGDSAGISFTLISHSTYASPAISKVRIVKNGTYDGAYLEVYLERDGEVEYTIYDNEQVNGWTPENWTVGNVPSGWIVHEYNVNNLFDVGSYDDLLILDRNGNLGIGTQPNERLDINGAMHLTPGAEPANPNVGDIYYDANDNVLKCYDGTEWKSLW